MKNTLKIAAGILGAIIVSAALAEVELTDVKSISISNVIGVQKIDSDKEYTPIAVCFGATAVATNRAINVVRPATNLVFTANLEAGDQLFVYDHARKGYVSYTLNAAKAWEADTVYHTTDSNQDLTPASDQSQAWGYGFWLRRKDISTRADKSIYLAGQVPVNQVSITIAPSTTTTYGKTLIGNPLGTSWNLNDKSIFDWSTVAKNLDHIQLNDANATLYIWRKARGKSTYSWVSGSGTGVIPAGAAFWYVRALQLPGEEEQQPITIKFRTGL